MNKIKKFPKDFFQLDCPTIPLNEALVDCIPLEWDEQIEFDDGKLDDVEDSILIKKIC